VDGSQDRIYINNISLRSQDFPSRKTGEEIISPMLKFKNVTIFYLLALVLSVLAKPTSTPTPEFHTEEDGYKSSVPLPIPVAPLFYSRSIPKI
jgi:hypothetical protein